MAELRARVRSSPAFFIVGGAWLATMASANLATPLYAVYQRRFGVSSAALTLVFATYALVLAPALLLFGQLSDRLGRRRVMAAGLVTASSALVLFALATAVQRPHVPAEIRVRFARLSITSAAVWAICALFLSVVPSYAAELLGTRNLALLGTTCGLILVSSCAAQLAARRMTAFARAQAAGLLLAAAGLAALVAAFPLHSLLLLIAAALLAGAGHGLAFLAAQSELNLAAPSDSRGEVNAAFYTLTYLGVAAAVIGTGLLTLAIPLSRAVTIFAAVIGAVLLATAHWHLKDAAAPRGRLVRRR